MDQHDSGNNEAMTLREAAEDIILQNQTLEALIKGLEGDIEIFKKDEEGKWTPADIVRFTMQLNIMRDKIQRNSEAINDLLTRHMKEQAEQNHE
jgi:hypothetical protein